MMLRSRRRRTSSAHCARIRVATAAEAARRHRVVVLLGLAPARWRSTHEPLRSCSSWSGGRPRKLHHDEVDGLAEHV